MLAIRATETWKTSSVIGAVFLALFVVLVLVALLRRYLRKP